MAGKRIRKHQIDEQRLIRPSRPDQAEQEKGPAGSLEQSQQANLDQAAVLQMQQTYGNAYVQRRLNDQNSAERSQQQAKSNAYAFETQTRIGGGGQMVLNIQKALDLKRYPQAGQNQEALSQWQGIGCLRLAGQEFVDKNMVLQNDGQLRLTAGQPFVEQVSRLTGSSYSKALADLSRPVSAKVKVTLHTNANDHDLRQAQLPGRESFLNEAQKKASPFFLKIEIESLLVVLKDGQAQEIKLEGEALLAGVNSD